MASTSSSRAHSPASFHPQVGGLLLDVKDLELFHFYTTTTSLTVSNIPERQQLWQQVVPKFAFSHPFLLHGLLAFSALHLAYLTPERRTALRAQAAAHHDAGVSLFRAAMTNITPENCNACFAFSSLLGVYAWASSDQNGDLFFSNTSSTGEQLTPEWANLLRGMQHLVEVAWQWLEQGPMKLLLYPWAMESHGMDPELIREAHPETSARLTSLSRLWDMSNNKFDPADVEVLDRTLSRLHEAYGMMKSSDSECQVALIGVALTWPIRVPERFLAMVNQLEPEALILLAHYSIILNKVDDVWFMHGMSGHLLRSIQQRLGKEWESWIAWPLQDLVMSEFKSGEMNT
jgi:hypothetical protein